MKKLALSILSMIVLIVLIIVSAQFIDYGNVLQKIVFISEALLLIINTGVVVYHIDKNF